MPCRLGGAMDYLRDMKDGKVTPPPLYSDRSTAAIARLKGLPTEVLANALGMTPFNAEEKAIRTANDSEYDLAGCVYMPDVGCGVARAIPTASIGANGYASMPNAPMHGIGREGGWPSIDASTELKTLNFNLDA
ncbi:aldehyde dehydrogenase family protein [Burkholderia sp. 4701]|nr:aldehyde dehydrogenase family protein [Burkholderia sp. 4701]MXN84668.1 aldehyde dehydrogenase family protein [Burkholderia sp. 4812]